MLFNSISFAIFLPIVFGLYWLLSGRLRPQNVLLLFASYYFYACWDYRFLFLLIFSTGLDYVTGLKMSSAANQREKTFWFWLSVSVNVAFLGVFKYYNFFVTSFVDALSLFHVHINVSLLQVILPVGISFYTFHGLSYVIDIYTGKTKPVREFIDYAVFVCFFPLLVAGPIERATHLLPQIQKNRVFDRRQASDGLRQILWGLFKKIAIADNCAYHVNLIFEHPEEYSGSALVLGAFLFAIQIYCDFSGYSDIALGTARLFGIELLRNFAFPYFSRDIAEFWRRWHISLTTWFRDYLYIPLGGSMGGTWMKIRNTLIIFLISGFWHGANWTFLFWGLINALYFIPLLLSEKNRIHTGTVAAGRWLPTIREAFQIATTFLFTTLAWIFFRAESLDRAFSYLRGIFVTSLFSLPKIHARDTLLLTIGFLVVEWIQRDQQHALALESRHLVRPIRWAIYYSILLITLLFAGSQHSFIYFQF